MPRTARSRIADVSRASERFPLGSEPTREYGEQEYLKDQKMKLTYEIGQLMKDLKPLRKKLREREAQFLDKGELEQIYMNQFGDISEAEHVMEQRERTSQIIQLQKEMNGAMNEYEELKFLVSMPLVHQLAIEVSDKRQELYKMREQCQEVQQEIEEVKRKIRRLRTSECYNRVQEQRHVIAELKEQVQAQINEHDKLREMSKRYVMDVHKLRQETFGQRDPRRRRENIEQMKNLERVLEGKEEILEAARSRYLTICENQEREIEEARYSRRLPKTEADDDESFSEPAQQLVLAVGLFHRAVSENEVRALFSGFGPINGLRIFPKKGSKPQAYFAKVAFYEHEDAEMAIAEMNGSFFEDYALNVKWAKDQAFRASIAPKPTTPKSSVFSETKHTKPKKKALLESLSSDSPAQPAQKRTQQQGSVTEALAIQPNPDSKHTSILKKDPPKQPQSSPRVSFAPPPQSSSDPSTDLLTLSSEMASSSEYDL